MSKAQLKYADQLDFNICDKPDFRLYIVDVIYHNLKHFTKEKQIKIRIIIDVYIRIFIYLFMLILTTKD